MEHVRIKYVYKNTPDLKRLTIKKMIRKWYGTAHEIQISQLIKIHALPR